jgi:Hint domain
MLSPQHSVLVCGARAELLFAEPELLVAAKHLVGMNGVRREIPTEGVTYVHVLFDRHEVILSEGVWSESFQPAMAMVNSFESTQRDEILGLFPELATAQIAIVDARPTLKAHEARVLMLAGASGEGHG